MLKRNESGGLSYNLNRRCQMHLPIFLHHLIATSVIPKVIHLTARPFQDKNIKEQVTNTTKSYGNAGPLLLHSLLNSCLIMFSKITITISHSKPQEAKPSNFWKFLKVSTAECPSEKVTHTSLYSLYFHGNI